MATISTALTTALEHHQGGRLEAAELIYRQILATDPNQADAMHLLGVIARQVGQHAVAVELIGRAIQLKGNSADFHNNLGGAYLELKKIPDAILSFRRAVQLKPDYAVAYSNLGHALREEGQLAEAAENCRRAVKLNPEYSDAHINLGNVLRDQGKLELAVASYQRALDRNPNLAIAHNNLGNALRDQNKLDKAVVSYRQALELNPQFAEAHNNLGNALKDLGHLDEAIVCWHRTLELNPESAEAFNNLGNALTDQGNLADAESCCRRALELQPGYCNAHNNLGNALLGQGKSEEAIACYRRVLELSPDDADVYNNLGGALQAQGKREEAASCHRRSLELKPDFAKAHSNVLLTLQYGEEITLAELFEAHAQFDRRHSALLCPDAKNSSGNLTREKGKSPHPNPLPAKPGRGDRNEPVPLRVGFVSADFGRHPVGYFLIGVLENLDRQWVETFCYSDGLRKDDLTNRLQTAATHWRDTAGISDISLAEQVRADQVDILFDLAGHTARNRLLAFARKPSPIQITWAGYACTTGLKAMDYILADRHEIPPEFERFYQEQVLRMPDGYICYEPPGYAPPISPLPASASTHVTFGCFNNPAKITPRVIEVWSKVLNRLPESRLVLKYKGWNDPHISAQMIDKLDRGIDPARVEFLGQSPHAEFLAEYNRIDLALDSFPYSGGLTTCEALWMGIPVITCPGETFASRHSLSHLSNVGLTESIASDLDEYVELAVKFATDLPRLAELRAGLRARMAASPLCDSKRFAENFVKTLQDLIQ